MQRTDAERSTVFIVDDDAEQRQFVATLVETVGLPSRQFSSGAEFLGAFDPSEPGCAVLDVRMAGGSGLVVLDGLNAGHANLPVVFVTAYATVPTAVRAIKHGAFEFLEKPVRPGKLLETIVAAVDLDRQRRGMLEPILEFRARFESLTRREREIARRMLEGEPNKVIAIDLGIAQKTVEIHRSRVLKKMEAIGVIDFIRNALEVERLDELVRKRLNETNGTHEPTSGPSGNGSSNKRECGGYTQGRFALQ